LGSPYWSRDDAARETPIELVGAYELVWRDYSTLDADRNSRFRYLVVVVE
jgi:hypothetical protein